VLGAGCCSCTGLAKGSTQGALPWLCGLWWQGGKGVEAGLRRPEQPSKVGQRAKRCTHRGLEGPPAAPAL
jgi:hypothetical protein